MLKGPTKSVYKVNLSDINQNLRCRRKEKKTYSELATACLLVSMDTFAEADLPTEQVADMYHVDDRFESRHSHQLGNLLLFYSVLPGRSAS